MSQPTRFRPGTVQHLCFALAQAVGVSASDADLLGESLVEADIAGTSTHGVSRTNIYLRRIQKGLIDPRAELKIDRQRAATLAIDAANGLGQVQASKTLDRLMPLARTAGVAVATIRRSQHCGALSWYCNRAAAENMVLLAMTNAEPSVAPAGSMQAYFGTNPLAVSFPTGKGFPVKIDLATSAIARGNIIAAQRKGQAIPEGWALDDAGEPTTDAAKALLGSLVPMAGHKGYALALMIELYSGVLSGSAIGSAIGSMYKHMDRPQDVGHFFCLIDIAAFQEPADFLRRIDATIDEIKACKPRPGTSEILVPGERSFRTAQANRRDGIVLGEETLKELRTLCDELGLPFSLDA